jgi:hypothetical protein
VGVINSILALANNTPGLQALPIDPATGVALNTGQHALRNGCNRIANGLTGGFVDPATGQTVLPKVLRGELLCVEPPVGTALYSANLGYSDYNSVGNAVDDAADSRLQHDGDLRVQQNHVSAG